jgi:nucleoside-diphosphate-sugar epimerase
MASRPERRCARWRPFPGLYGAPSVTKTVLVLGASGYVGSRLVEALRRTDWATPVAGMRPRTVRGATPPGIEVRTYEARNPSSLEATLVNIDCVVNCVAGDPGSMIMSARHLFAAALGTRVERVVHISSMVVYGGATGVVDEQSPIAAGGGGYTRAKLAGERLARDYSQRGGKVVVLRPSCIYGPGSEQWTGRIGRLLRARRIGDLGPAGDGCCNLIYIDDMVSAVVQALRRPGLDGEVFNVSEPDPETWNRYFVRFGRALGATPIRRISSRRLMLETKLLAPILQASRLLGRRLGMEAVRLPEPIPTSLALLWRQDIRLDHRKSDALLRFSRTSLADGVAASARWLGP